MSTESTIIRRIMSRRFSSFVAFLGILIGVFAMVLITSSKPTVLTDILSHISLAVIVASIASIFFETAINKQTERLSERQADLEKIVHNELSETKSMIYVASSGIERVFRNESEINKYLPSVFGATNYRADIFRLSFFFWDSELKNSIRRALSRGVEFRVLQIDPEAPLLEYYADQEHRDNLGLSTELNRSIEQWLSLSTESSNLEIRLYRGPITISVLAADDTMFIGPYLGGKGSHGAPQLQLASGPMFRAYSAYFENCWNQSEPLRRES